MADAGEFPLTDGFPAWLAGVPAPAVAVGSGADCAVLRAALAPAAPEVLLTTDAQIEGYHFRRDWCTWADVGWRALAAATSDVAAMGGRCLGAVVALAVPPATPVADLREFAEGLRACGMLAGCPVVGGNLKFVPGGWSVTTSVLGTPGGRWLRAGARAGDAVWVSGRPGRAHAGLRALTEGLLPTGPGVPEAWAAFRRPKPRFAVVDAIGAATVHAAIDLSDSLVRSAERIGHASGLAIALDPARLPIDRATTAIAAALGEDALDYVLHGGESVELCCTAPPSALDGVAVALAGTGIEWTAVGEVVAGPAGQVTDPSGAPLHPSRVDEQSRRG